MPSKAALLFLCPLAEIDSDTIGFDLRVVFVPKVLRCRSVKMHQHRSTAWAPDGLLVWCDTCYV